MKLFGKILEGGLRLIRAANRIPLRWHISSGVQLRKKCETRPHGPKGGPRAPDDRKGVLFRPPPSTSHDDGARILHR
eukprot:8525000-Pyramimonas_sp.AAC.1